MLTTQLIVFSKSPELGRVKTRMQPHLSQAQSILLHQDLTAQAIVNAAQWAETSQAYSAKLSIAGRLDHPFILGQIQQYPAVSLIQQASGDLGQKMACALDDALNQSDQAVIIGADCPFIDTAHLTEAEASFVQAELVLTPALDGGYVLIAARQSIKPKLHDLLSNIDWGTERVLEQTLSNASDLGIKVSCTAPLADIDYVEDLLCLKGDLRVSKPLQQWGALAALINLTTVKR